jgi:hypothetical protein
MQGTVHSETAADFCQATRNGIARKADHNKREAMAYLTISLAATLLAPLFITLGEGMFFGKAVPAGLSVIASFCTAWLQLRKPQQLWSLYRGAQREIEDEQTKFNFRIGDYASAAVPDKLIVERVAAIALQLHQKWSPLVPNPESPRPPTRSPALAESVSAEGT